MVQREDAPELEVVAAQGLLPYVERRPSPPQCPRNQDGRTFGVRAREAPRAGPARGRATSGGRGRGVDRAGRSHRRARSEQRVPDLPEAA